MPVNAVSRATHDPAASSLVRSTHDHRAAYRLPALRCDQPFTARTAARWRQVRILSPAALRRTAGGAGADLRTGGNPTRTRFAAGQGRHRRRTRTAAAVLHPKHTDTDARAPRPG